MEEQKPQGMFDNVPPKFTFMFGLVIGIAAFSLFGYVSLLSQVSGDSATTNTGKTAVADSGEVAGDTATNPTDTTAPTAGSVDVKPVSNAEYIRGNENAPVTIIEYSDLECPFCKNFHETMVQAMDKYPDDVRWVVRHFPLSFHANAQKEAEAAECVGELGGAQAYWDYIDAIFERTTANGTGFALTALAPLAGELGLSESTVQECIDSGKYASKVSTDLNEGSAAGVSGTPTSFVLDADGNVVQTIPGALSLPQVEQAISAALGK